MTEDDAQGWLVERLNVSDDAMEKLTAFRAMVVAENTSQNLVSAASIDHFWVRHIVDSAQLLCHADSGPWLDLGTGAGFPGMVIAILRAFPVTFVESRRKRIDFLAAAATQLGLDHVTVEGARLDTVPTQPFRTISARAFAPLPKLLVGAHRFSNNETIWVLPKGRGVHEELESIKRSWQGVFHVKQSVTDPDAQMIVASAVRPIKRQKRG
jgi:16S rRNA (guanine527-N7)-methyltransferase